MLWIKCWYPGVDRQQMTYIAGWIPVKPILTKPHWLHHSRGNKSSDIKLVLQGFCIINITVTVFRCSEQIITPVSSYLFYSSFFSSMFFVDIRSSASSDGQRYRQESHKLIFNSDHDRSMIITVQHLSLPISFLFNDFFCRCQRHRADYTCDRNVTSHSSILAMTAAC